jgi:hypothetical protein
MSDDLRAQIGRAAWSVASGWDGCTGDDCLPACRVTSTGEGSYCAQYGERFADAIFPIIEARERYSAMDGYASEQGVLNAKLNAAIEAQLAEQARRAPHVLMRPRVFPDGNMWCALLGDDLQMGVAAFGDTPEAACVAFDEAWRTATLSALQEPVPRLAGEV